MNILLVGPDLNAKGGMATVIRNFLEAETPPDLNFYYHKTWSEKWTILTQIIAFFSFRYKIKKNNCQIIHFHVAQKGSFYRKSMLLLLAPKKCKVIFHLHASKFDQFYQNSHRWEKWWIRQIFEQVDQLVVLSQSWANFYQSITTTAIDIIPNAVELPDKNVYDANAEWILTLGRIGQRKGSFDVLEVAKEIAIEFPSIRFVMYGDQENADIDKQIKHEKIYNVYLKHWIGKEEMPEILNQSVLHFLPSYHEGMPMSILETMASGIPNLSTKVGGIPELIQHNRNGYLVDAGDTQAMVETLKKFLKNENYRKKISQKSRETIIEKYGLPAYLLQWNQIYIKQLD